MRRGGKKSINLRSSETSLSSPSHGTIVLSTVMTGLICKKRLGCQDELLLEPYLKKKKKSNSSAGIQKTGLPLNVVCALVNEASF